MKVLSRLSRAVVFMPDILSLPLLSSASGTPFPVPCWTYTYSSREEGGAVV